MPGSGPHKVPLSSPLESQRASPVGALTEQAPVLLSGRYAVAFAVICGAGLASLRTVLAEFFSPEDPLVQVRAHDHLQTKFPQTSDRSGGWGFHTADAARRS